MNASFLLKNVNDKQRDAVSASRVNLLVLAGAGSGKTRVLVHRIAWLQTIENCLPSSIMAITFTNKAAEEIRHRIFRLVNNRNDQNKMWIGTFHGFAHRLLRIHYTEANLPKNFQILDNEDQLYLLKRLVKMMKINEKKLILKQVMWYINTKKNEGLRFQHIKNFKNSSEKIFHKIYQNYQEICDRAGLVDFSELLLRTYELYIKQPYILKHYQERFTNILIDEFQDTNHIQYSLIHLLSSKTGRTMIVGDDDQSIYSWRGAQIGNIYRFLKDFPNVKTIRLEQNYRSTNNILNTANALIKHNNLRLKKKLWTKDIDGEPVSIYCALNELDEARFVVNAIKIWKYNGGQFKQCAILYRKNSQSRVLEEYLLQEKIPYQIYGGTDFFSRREIKDVLSYLRLITNCHDDAAFERAVNTPSRGIGNRTLSLIRQISKDYQLTLWQASYKILKKKLIIGHTANSLQLFLKLIKTLEKKISELPIDMQVDLVIKNSGLWMMYKKEKRQSRIDNLEELKTAIYQFNCKKKDENLTPIQAFLSYIALEYDKKQIVDNNQDSVQLMTLHSAKGLEFPQVFIVGMEEGIFPNHLLMNEGILLEEERRLAYVGVTRAMQKLTLSYAKTRRLYGKDVYHLPSRFISELPKKYIKTIKYSFNRKSFKQAFDF